MNKRKGEIERESKTLINLSPGFSDINRISVDAIYY